LFGLLQSLKLEFNLRKWTNETNHSTYFLLLLYVYANAASATEELIRLTILKRFSGSSDDPEELF